MEPLELSTIIDVTGGVWSEPGPPPSVLVGEISTDTRTLGESSVFVALEGDRFDGHAYVGEARKRGAVASIVRRDAPLPEGGGPYILVDEPIGAFESLARWNRDRLSLECIAVTGSVGKTSTKEFLATVLSHGFRVRSAPKSFNNRVGVAATLLAATPETEVLVAELGTNARGEISHLARIARPHRIVITEIAPTHLSGLRDLDGVVEAKAEIFEGLEPGGTAFLRHGVYGFERFRALAKGPVLSFGWGEGDFAVTDCRRVTLGHDANERSGHVEHGYLFTIGRENFLLPVAGKHNVLNAAAAVAVARDLGMKWEDIRAALSQCRLPPLRLQIHRAGGFTLIDDTYNASPASMEAAMEEWSAISAGSNGVEAPGAGAPGSRHRVAVLGDMLEMGAESRRLHEAVGDTLLRLGARLVVTVGADSRWIAERCRDRSMDSELLHVATASEAVAVLKDRLVRGDAVLFKASRRIGLDAAVADLRKWATADRPVAGGEA